LGETPVQNQARALSSPLSGDHLEVFLMSKALRYLSLAVLVALFASSATANSVSLGHVNALQNNGFTQVDLFTNRGVTLSPTTLSHPFQTQLSFMVPFAGTILPGGETLSISAVIMGSTFTQNFAIAAGTYSSFSQFVTFTFPKGIFHSTPVTLGVQLFTDGGRLLRSSDYSFNFVEPVPEPGTLLLVGSGVVATVIRKRKRA